MDVPPEIDHRRWLIPKQAENPFARAKASRRWSAACGS